VQVKHGAEHFGVLGPVEVGGAQDVGGQVQTAGTAISCSTATCAPWLRSREAAVWRLPLCLQPDPPEPEWARHWSPRRLLSRFCLPQPRCSCPNRTRTYAQVTAATAELSEEMHICPSRCCGSPVTLLSRLSCRLPTCPVPITLEENQ
jgi:hypothetical protein